MAEIASYLYLRKKGLTISKPDFTLYNGKQKSYAPDLTDGIQNYCIKTQSKKSASKYGKSWVFSKGNMGTDPVTQGSNSILVLTITDDPFVEVLGCLLSSKARQYLKDLKESRLNKHKIALYYDDVKDFLK